MKWTMVRDVTIARTGTQVCDESELPCFVSDEDGEIVVTCDADEVFHLETLSSIEGMAFTLGYPEEMINPANSRAYAHEHIQNVR
ncbi:DUF2213 domain-containing protein [Kosakonia cowanii]|uniref:DUF2213 domain-containing protein n=1 Tax=Kosakonia cowanii TaxID=208223 RepID=UPI0012FD870E|nr:DUF2213 domain-containing protein [Kosakonia cowanii]